MKRVYLLCKKENLQDTQAASFTSSEASQSSSESAKPMIEAWRTEYNLKKIYLFRSDQHEFSGSRTGGIHMKVLEFQPAKCVKWGVIDDPEEWISTKISWKLKQEDNCVIVLFKHHDWKESVEFMPHCSTKWGIF